MRCINVIAFAMPTVLEEVERTEGRNTRFDFGANDFGLPNKAARHAITESEIALRCTVDDRARIGENAHGFGSQFGHSWRPMVSRLP